MNRMHAWVLWKRSLLVLSRVFLWLAGAAVLLSILVLLVEAFGRYLFNAPTSYAYGLTGLIVVLTLYLGLAHTATIDGHVSSDIVFSLLPLRAQSVILLISEIIATLLGGAIAIYVSRSVGTSWTTGATIPDVFHMPLALPQAVVVIGAALFALVSLTKVPHHIRNIILGRREPVFLEDSAEHG